MLIYVQHTHTSQSVQWRWTVFHLGVGDEQPKFIQCSPIMQVLVNTQRRGGAETNWQHR